MKKWVEYLESGVYNRLCNCTTIKEDLSALVNARYRSYKDNGKLEKGFTKEDALVEILELLDCNGQFFDLSRDEYDELKN